jgi:hypothetical protein
MKRTSITVSLPFMPDSIGNRISKSLTSVIARRRSKTCILLAVIAAGIATSGCSSRADKADKSLVPQQPQQVAGTQQGLQPSTNVLPPIASTPASLHEADRQSETQIDFEVAGIRLGMTRQETEQTLHDMGFSSPTCAKMSSSVFCVTDVRDEQGWLIATVKYNLANDSDRVSDVIYSFAPKLLAKMKSGLIAKYGKPSGTEDGAFAAQRFTVWRSGRAEIRLGRDGDQAVLILQLNQS